MRPALPAADETAEGPGSWRPIATGALAWRAEAALLEIAAEIDGAGPEALPPGAPAAYGPLQRVNLGSGAAGVALFHAQLAVATGEPAERDRALQAAAACARALAELTMGPSLFGGFAGLAWAVETVARYLDGGAGDLAAEIDEALAGHVERTPWRGEYDLVSGLVGFAVYALDRLPAPSAVRLLEAVLDRLEELAAPGGPGVTWLTPRDLLPPHQREIFPDGCWNLGVAHGVPGVVAALAGMVRAEVQVARARLLLRAAGDWLLAQRREGCPAFPALVGQGGETAPGRLAWCYGDPGVALALLAGGSALGDADLVNAALDLALEAAAQPLERSGVVDAGLCHGAAGLAHIFNRIHQATGDDRLATAARRWLAVTLDLRRPGEAVAGYPAWEAMPQPHWAPTPGLVGGAAGVGLALSAAIHGVEPRWDACLLMRLPRIEL